MLTPQAQQVLKYLIEMGHISQLYASSEFGIARLAARVHDLRQHGIPVRTRMKKSFSGKRYAQYYIDGSRYGAFNFRG